MHKQMILQLTRNATLQRIYEALSEESRERMRHLYGSLIAHAVREPMRPTNTEKDHETGYR